VLRWQFILVCSQLADGLGLRLSPSPFEASILTRFMKRYTHLPQLVLRRLCLGDSHGIYPPKPRELPPTSSLAFVVIGRILIWTVKLWTLLCDW